MNPSPVDINDLYARRGDRTLTRYNQLVGFADERLGVTLSKDVLVHSLPDGGMLITARSRPNPWIHAWYPGTPDNEAMVVVGEGLVNGAAPWVSEDLRVGERDEDGNFARVEMEPQNSGVSYVAVGVNVAGESNSSTEFAEISDEAGYDTLRVAEIKSLPRGYGSGGVRISEGTAEEGGGWAWYALSRYHWSGGRVEKLYPIVYHNLQHEVIAGGVGRTQERHFFYPA